MTDLDDILPIDAAAQFGPNVVLPVSEEPEPEPEGLEEVKTDLDPRARQDFIGLLYLGYLEEEVKVAGHRFLLRTPSQAERLEIGALHKPFLNTVSTEPAWRVLMVASYLRRIDAEPAPEPLAIVSPLRARWEWVQDSIHSPVMIEHIYDRCMMLEFRARAVVEALDGQGES
jgi:hypothetical protein